MTRRESGADIFNDHLRLVRTYLALAQAVFYDSTSWGRYALTIGVWLTMLLGSVTGYRIRGGQVI